MILKKENYSYSFDTKACYSCRGNCCVGKSGYIWIKQDEINILAQYLKISLDKLKKDYLKRVGPKYSIKELKLDKDTFSCLFFDLNEKKCSIYEIRPLQCRTFPFWDYYKNNEKEVYEECPGIKPL